MKATRQDLTTNSSAALSRRAFMQGVGGVTLSLVLGVHGANPGMRTAGAMPQLPGGGGGGQVIGWTATQGNLLQLPFWGDSGKWDDKTYYETIQTGRRPSNRTVQNADIDGDGRDELLVRGVRGLLVHRFSPEEGQWIQLPDGPVWDDATGWNADPLRLTIQTADVNGDHKAEVIVLGRPGSDNIYYDPITESWGYLPEGRHINENEVLEKDWYYRTMQCADIDGDLQDELLIRDVSGMRTFKFIPEKDKPEDGHWNELATVADMSDANKWNQPQYYKTIQCACIDGEINGKRKAALLGRYADGVHVWRYDADNNVWNLDPNVIAQMGYGWDYDYFYNTIQCADIDGDGKAEVLGLYPSSAKGTPGMTVWKYNGGWEQMQMMTAWSFPDVSNANSLTYETIQCADVDGDGRAELLGRVGSGIQVFKYDGGWGPLKPNDPAGPAWSNANGWNQPQYFQTIQTARALKPGDPGYTGDGKSTQSILIGRSSDGMQTYRYDADLKQWVNPTRPFPTFTGDQLNAYQHLPKALGLHNVGQAGVRGIYHDLVGDWEKWTTALYGSSAIDYDQAHRPPCLLDLPPGVTQDAWNAVTWQIYWEMLWVRNVQKWYGDLSVKMMNATFLGEELILPAVGKYLTYSDGNSWPLALSILSLVTGAMASALAFPGVGAGAAVALVGILSRVFSAAAMAMPGGGGSFNTTYGQLQTQLADSFHQMLNSLGTTMTTITGGNAGQNGAYIPGDYGLLKAIGQMIESTIWTWPSNSPNLIAQMQRGYATEVFKVLFTGYQKNAGYFNHWIAFWNEEQSVTYYPGNYPVTSSLLPASKTKDGWTHWLVYKSNHSDYPPEATLRAMFDPPTEKLFPLGIAPADFYNWPAMLGEANPLIGEIPPSLGADLRVSATLTRDPAMDQIVATVTVRNLGIGRAPTVELIDASLNQKRPLSYHAQRTHLLPGQSHVYTMTFPAMASGTTAVLRVAGRYLYGTFGGSFRVNVPR